MKNPIHINGLSGSSRDFALQQIDESLYRFRVNGVPGTVEIYEGSCLSKESIARIEEC